MWYLYIIPKNNKYYTGIMTDLKNLLRRHRAPPLLHKEASNDKFEAAKREKQINGRSRSKKEQLIAKFGR
jgi:predicted GIY-YIG superfamily endonuclease